MTAENNLYDRLQEDLTWRIRELSEIVRACKEAAGTRKAALLRASVPVIYAHWEGYFVFSANSYLNFLTEKRISIGMLRNEFWALTVRKRYKPQQISGDVHFNRFLLEVRSEPDRIFKKGNFERINGASNLKSDVVIFCCGLVGIDHTVFNEYFEFIDEELLNKRNHIAHGSSLRFDEGSIGVYRDKVVDLMRITQNQIENAVTAKTYLRKQSPVA